jgi:hypothetical protein
MNKDTKNKKQTISVCRFQRREGDEWETGIIIGGDDVIIDSNYKFVCPVWDYSVRYDRGCFVMEFD